ncbi:unnamed protein product, partial [Amoebophrya sp. A120]
DRLFFSKSNFRLVFDESAGDTYGYPRADTLGVPEAEFTDEWCATHCSIANDQGGTPCYGFSIHLYARGSITATMCEFWNYEHAFCEWDKSGGDSNGNSATVAIRKDVYDKPGATWGWSENLRVPYCHDGHHGSTPDTRIELLSQTKTAPECRAACEANDQCGGVYFVFPHGDYCTNDADDMYFYRTLDPQDCLANYLTGACILYSKCEPKRLDRQYKPEFFETVPGLVCDDGSCVFNDATPIALLLTSYVRFGRPGGVPEMEPPQDCT